MRRHRKDRGLTVFRKNNGSLLSITGSLLGTTVVTSAFGVAYWLIVARLAPVGMVGYATSTINGMSLAGTIGMLGLGSMLIGELQHGRLRHPGLVTASLGVAAAASAAIAAAFVLITRAGWGTLISATDPIVAACYVAGAGLTGALFVLDQAMVGSRLGSAQLARNTAFAVGKVLCIPVCLLLLPIPKDLAIFLSWLLGMVLSIPVALRALRGAGVVSRRADAAALFARYRIAMAHNVYNIASQLSRLAMPIVATTFVSAEAGGAFFMAWMIAGLMYIVPSHLSTALFAIGSGRLDEVRDKLRVSLRLAALAGLIGVPLVWVFAPLALRLFGSTYAGSAAGPLRWLALCYVLMALKYHYVAVTRVEDRLMTGTIVATVGAGMELVAAAYCASRWGLMGLVAGFAAAMSLQMLVMVPDIWRAAKRAPSTVAPMLLT